MKEIITDSIRYWERRRIAFNAALAAVVAGSFLYHHSAAAGRLTWQPVIGLFVAAMVANALYCTVYAADIFFQSSGHQPAWRRCRWVVWAAGTALAAALFLLHE